MTADLPPLRDRVSDALSQLAPEDCLAPLLDLLEDAAPDVFWPLFQEWFHLCDNIWPHRGRLRRRLIRAGNAYPYLSAEDRQALDDLWIEQWVLRGCSSGHKKGLSWVADYDVADGFARWHSAPGRPGNVYAAIICKPAIFTVVQSRGGPTILLDYERLQDIQREEKELAYSDHPPTFAPDGNYRDANDDGKTAELILTEATRSRTRKVAPPPIENMRPSELEAMLAEKIQQLKTAKLRLQITALEADIRRARNEIAARKRGALPGRKAKKHGASWDQKRRRGGRPTTASRIVTLPGQESPITVPNDDQGARPEEKRKAA